MLRIGGFTPLSTTDWPGMLAAVVFCQGCPWRCCYCHNPGLIPARGEHELSWESVLGLLHRRIGLLDGVVFSGGEPTLQAGLPDAMGEVRELGFSIGLHTGGMYPQRLATVLPLLDWVGMDVKAPFADYDRITGAPRSGDRALASLDLILQSGVEHEIRTTVHPVLLDDETVQTLANDLAERGVRHYAIQAFRAQGCEDEFLNRNMARQRSLASLGRDIAGQFQNFALRDY
ncbi:MAG TPA: anaerobic ribonucleoside-triphosphate reductase activating protein [Thiobacillaceae bacterium]|nr:anaerobic ribonucleoside-triphosphate reductase activating protein [Thiobacillaceae bacterium]